jgi:streptomycin 6-kinase
VLFSNYCALSEDALKSNYDPRSSPHPNHLPKGEGAKPSQLLDRIKHYASAWDVDVADTLETESSVIAFGMRDNHAVVLKVIKKPGDEWRSGEMLKAFDGYGVARVYEWAPGAVLVERLQPGNSLVELALNGRDDEATDILTGVIQQMSAPSSMSPFELPQACATVHDWAKGFERYIATGDDQIPKDLVEAGQRVYSSLCASQRRPRLLHGDLQHYNVLLDSERGWLAIDPKGVVGEIEYEIGAVLRNPYERPEIFLSPATIKRRLEQFTGKLNLDYERTLGWAFAQAVLSAIWTIEDGFVVDAMNPGLRLANVIRPMPGSSF